MLDEDGTTKFVARGICLTVTEPERVEVKVAAAGKVVVGTSVEVVTVMTTDPEVVVMTV